MYAAVRMSTSWRSLMAYTASKARSMISLRLSLIRSSVQKKLCMSWTHSK